MALCYYKSPKDSEPKGWIYLRDVVEVSEDKASFTIVSPARTMTLEANSNVETKIWLSAILAHCKHAKTNCVSLASSKLQELR